MGAHVFLSYASADRALADEITRSLGEAGLTVTRPDTIAAPTDGPSLDALKTALTNADVMIAIVPPTGTPGSNNVSFEVGAADALDKPVVAVTNDVSDAIDFGRFQPVSAKDLPDLVRHVRALLKGQ
ncbi:hypothetical protein A33M_3503 [Rhodovulum sp. PH10]|uniref:toll/interleukin-1 receptor domain-containing protein n=1 Tax=Rhodovulum sp. PH10 TaxID=1187851 RepID=UPI00027C1F8E|nr:toll/interleukin-1 receptor domain-containing protein [Rhodovulum sp. PH10]EJW13519.1 hypothetical protein A33M_3503 [Rhodovulum sp. PH10]